MGKEWYWAGKSSKRETPTQTQTPSGCMCAFFQFFDFHPFHFPTINNQQQTATFNSASCITEDHTTIPKGAEAPRNSLESKDGTISSPPKEENFKIPKNIQIKTNGCGKLNDLSSEISNNSPSGIKTPTLVARLMGLDLLPHSPSSSSSSNLSTPNPQCNIVPNLHHMRLIRQQRHIQTKPRNSTDSSEIGATRSLPETPRISSSRRSDVDYHHRLSLQINKENIGEDLDLPRLSFCKKRYDENNSRSPSHYARQIVKQVKESVSRKVGQDITNTLKTKEQTKEEIVSQIRIKKSPKPSLKVLDESNHSSSYSPRLRFIETNKHKQSTEPSSPLISKDQNMPQPMLPRVLTKPKPQQQEFPNEQELQKQKSVPKCKKARNESFNSRLIKTDIIRNKQEESFIIIRPTSPTRVNDIKTTKSKRTRSLSSNLLDDINSVSSFLPVKTDPSPPATKIPQKQVYDTQEAKRIAQLCSGSRHKYKQEVTNTLATPQSYINNEDKPIGASTIAAEEYSPEFQYITAILMSRTTTTTTTMSFNQWFSLTHSLDPSIFHHLEAHRNDKDCNFTSKNQLGYRWNRRLLFDLVDEVLLETLRPKKSEKELWFLHGCCYNQGQGNVEGLVERVWKRIGKFPCAKCEVLEDIDGLIEVEDMEQVKVRCEEGLEEEGQGLIADIEGNIWDTLVDETVMVISRF
ncbi:hypothetical protein RIF29_13379 [Crotalaria pallida]|uniref:DUF4378 domain-containing protein n=1 Tax=Crotalaria pallida TaxID=3830 RepID=A0AAN9IP53_CROPI